jgi:hypothetical protein
MNGIPGGGGGEGRSGDLGGSGGGSGAECNIRDALSDDAGTENPAGSGGFLHPSLGSSVRHMLGW